MGCKHYILMIGSSRLVRMKHFEHFDYMDANQISKIQNIAIIKGNVGLIRHSLYSKSTVLIANIQTKVRDQSTMIGMFIPRKSGSA